MTHLVHLVKADGHGCHLGENVADVGLAGGQRCNASARECHLAGGAYQKRPVRGAVFFALGQDAGNRAQLIGQVVYTVGIVPDDLEIRRASLHTGQAAHGLSAVDVAVRVGIQRHAPDALHAGIGGELLHQVHIGAILMHRHRDHLEAEIFGDGKMSVVAGHRAQEFQLLFHSPGMLAVRKAYTPAHIDHVVHQCERGVSAHDDLVLLHAHQLGKEAAGLGHAGQQAVVAGILTVFSDVFVLAEQPVGQLQLFGAGLAAGHIQLQPLGLILLILCQNCLVFLLQLLFGHALVFFHCKRSSFAASQRRTRRNSAPGAGWNDS